MGSPMRALLRGVLAIKASQRPSMTDIIEHMATKHEWYEGGKKQAITSYGMRDLTPERERKAAKQAQVHTRTKAAPVQMQVVVVPNHQQYDREQSSGSSGSSPLSIHDAIEPLDSAIAAKYTSKSKQQQHHQHNQVAPQSKYESD